MLSLSKTGGWRYGNKASLVLTYPTEHYTAINCPQDYRGSQWSPCRGQQTRTCDCWALSLLSSLALIKSMNDPVFVFVFWLQLKYSEQGLTVFVETSIKLQILHLTAADNEVFFLIIQLLQGSISCRITFHVMRWNIMRISHSWTSCESE